MLEHTACRPWLETTSCKLQDTPTLLITDLPPGVLAGSGGDSPVKVVTGGNCFEASPRGLMGVKMQGQDPDTWLCKRT
jgi:hypothetical protein